MPRNGFESNVESIDAKILQDFQTSNITPSKVIVCANGIKNHREFVDLAEETIGVLNPVRESEYLRKKSEYIGGEYRVFTETPDTNIILGYESVPWNHDLMPSLAVLHMIFGSATGFSVGGPGKGMLNRSHKNILRQKNYISDCESINLHFSDSGLFALNFTGQSSHSKQILNDIVETFNDFRRPIEEEEINRAKNMLKRSILLTLENQGDRLEESCRNLNTYGKLTFETYCDKVNNVTSQSINQAVEILLKTKPTLVVTGNAVNLVPSIADITGRIK
jgi:predicted Zn-dependent peptidase